MDVHNQIEQRFVANLVRVRWLVKLFQDRPRGLTTGYSGYSDLLRAAVILLHASLEDMLRSLAQWKLPQSPAKFLERIFLVGSGKQTEKFTLVDLAEFRGQTVDEVIARSVESHLLTSSYNHPGDIAEVLVKIGLTYRIDDSRRNALASMMSRRHQIAHSADSRSATSFGIPIVLSIEDPLVTSWIHVVEQVGLEILSIVGSVP